MHTLIPYFDLPEPLGLSSPLGSVTDHIIMRNDRDKWFLSTLALPAFAMTQSISNKKSKEGEEDGITKAITKWLLVQLQLRVKKRYNY